MGNLMSRRNLKFIILCFIFVMSLCSCGSGDAKITHNFLESDERFDTDLVCKTSVTTMKELNPEDTRSTAEILKEELNGSSEKFNAPSVDFELSEIYVTDIKPACNSVSFYVSTVCDVTDLQVVFIYDTGDQESIKIPLLPANEVFQVTINKPAEAKKIALGGYSYKPANILCENNYYVNAKKSDIDKHCNFTRLSNNTLQFKCDTEKRFLVYDKIGIILDDVTLRGSGTLITANGAYVLKEVSLSGV